MGVVVHRVSARLVLATGMLHFTVLLLAVLVMFGTTATITKGGRGFRLAAATRTLGKVPVLSPGQKLVSAMFAAKVKCLTIAFSTDRRRFVHRHSANEIFSHTT